MVSPANKLVEGEMAAIFVDSAVEVECMALLRLLAVQDDPASPQDQKLDVFHLEHHARDWYRLKIRSCNVRFVFSRHYVNGDDVLLYRYGELPFDDTDNLLALRFAGYRDDNTYIEVRRRYQNRAW